MLKLEGSSGVAGGWAPRACESCRSAPCAVYCRADAAALCAACDASIHSANPLARRHHRVPVLPAAGGLVVRPSLNHAYHVGVPVGLDGAERGGDCEDDDEEAASWLLPDPVKDGDGLAFGEEEVDEFLDLVEYNTRENQRSEGCHGQKSEESECVVPNDHHQHHPSSLQMEYDVSNGFNYCASLTSVVPDTSAADISNAHIRAPKGTIDLFSGHPLQLPPQFNAMDREARVLRYREKRKTRKFEKTIRYASRKAYAETRPRIKGRFAKKTDVDVEVDEMFSATALGDSNFGLVPSY
ncbi:zinc finger protein CO3-like [Canna indica]|uniref:Zinc finger protein CO3-like n=1 Tax=Canna indica TaxID=4628 RepID=A0AAQ3JMG0_9LILI|nr:zinc finger protein CO3-like [Canna indica]